MRETTLGEFSIIPNPDKGLPCERHTDQMAVKFPEYAETEAKTKNELEAQKIAMLEAKRRFNSIGPKPKKVKKLRSPRQVEHNMQHDPKTQIFPSFIERLEKEPVQPVQVQAQTERGPGDLELENDKKNLKRKSQVSFYLENNEPTKVESRHQRDGPEETNDGQTTRTYPEDQQTTTEGFEARKESITNDATPSESIAPSPFAARKQTYEPEVEKVDSPD